MITNPKYNKMLDELLEVCRRHLPSVNEPLITKSFEFCLEAHKNDLRASGEPYFTHPYEVALIVAKEIPLDDITIVSTLLHDVVEDKKATLKEIRVCDALSSTSLVVNGFLE